MSRHAIWSLNATRSELGKSTKGQIYLSKIAIGAVVAFALWLVSLGMMSTVLIASAAVFITSKVSYYLATGDWPDGWDCIADWITDGILHFAWYVAWQGIGGDWGLIVGTTILFVVCYPFSCE
jgi:hypothetical protein